MTSLVKFRIWKLRLQIKLRYLQLWLIRRYFKAIEHLKDRRNAKTAQRNP